MARKKKHEEHVNHERWLVSYADFITLLFAFFVILYALSEVDKNKLKKFAKSVQFAFAHVGSGGTMTQGKNADTFKPKVIGSSWPQGRRESDPGPFEGLTSIVQFLENSIMQWFLREEEAQVEVLDDEKGVVVRMPAERLFAPGSSSLRPDRVDFFRDFGAVVARNNVSFQIRLHLEVPVGVDDVSENALGSQRVNAIVRQIRRAGQGRRARFSHVIDLEHMEGVETSRAENSRSVFEFYISP